MLELIKKEGITQVYLLAAVLSATGEKDPKRAWEINMQSLLVKRTTSMAMRATQTMVQVSNFTFASGPLDDKSKGDEKVFFNKEDQKVLNALLKKMQTQAK
jgi:hypothetical protein